MNTKLKSDYEKACNAYLQAFCEKHGYDYEDAARSWVGGDVGGYIELSSNPELAAHNSRMTVGL